VRSCTIDVGIMHYRDLNALIREKILEGCAEIVLEATGLKLRVLGPEGSVQGAPRGEGTPAG